MLSKAMDATTAPPDPETARRALADLLAFYAAAGVDAALGDEALDRLAEPPPVPGAVQAMGEAAPDPQARPLLRSAPPPPAAPAPLAPDAAAMAAREQAARADSLDALRALMERFEGCALKQTASRLVFADGNPKARLMLVGEAPGREEDIEGRPFVGRSGQLLDRMLKAIGLDRTSVYIANTVPWRPPGNRTPTPQETAICKPFVTRQIELVDPDILVCLGGPASTALLDIRDGVMKARGRWMTYRSTREIKAMATFHPAYLLRSPAQKGLVWRDLQAIRDALKSLG
jgi:DNA polymerase